MKPIYIHSAACISPQSSFDREMDPLEFIKVEGKKASAIHPNYKDYIIPSALRRMATGVKMGAAAATKALQDANVEQPETILTGTGMGCIEDTEKFLNSIIVNNEEFLTPTSFIQSTHNTVGAQIALGLQCKAYNNTYVHGALSFESALIDAQLLIQQEGAKHVLVGGIDELGTEFVDAVRMMEDQQKDGIKVPIGEGASFFVLSPEPRKNGVEILDVIAYSQLNTGEIVEKVNGFLALNDLRHSEIDTLVLGKNGDNFDDYYKKLADSFPTETASISYKEFCGEFNTASAFGLFFGYQLLKSQKLPKTTKTILLYNQFKGRDHSFILLKLC